MGLTRDKNYTEKKKKKKPPNNLNKKSRFDITRHTLTPVPRFHRHIDHLQLNTAPRGTAAEGAASLDVRGAVAGLGTSLEPPTPHGSASEEKPPNIERQKRTSF